MLAASHMELGLPFDLSVTLASLSADFLGAREKKTQRREAPKNRLFRWLDSRLICEPDMMPIIASFFLGRECLMRELKMARVKAILVSMSFEFSTFLEDWVN